MANKQQSGSTEQERMSREEANRRTVELISRADPVLIDIVPAIEALPGMQHNVVLTSGAPMPFESYVGGQRQGLIGGALYEGLADTAEEAERLFEKGEIQVGVCHDFGCVGSLAGITTASMPVVVVRDEANGTKGHCTLYEGESLKRLNYGVYDDEVDRNLRHLKEEIAPALRDAVQEVGGLSLLPLMRRALRMGDELHSRNTAATILFTREILPGLLKLAARQLSRAEQLASYLGSSDYFFLRLGMAAGKAAADAAHGIQGSSVVTAMTFSCLEFSIRVSGLGDRWFSAPLPSPEAQLFDGYIEDDIEFMGGESTINETVGLGGFAQAAAFALQRYQGGSPDKMIEDNLNMYEITVGEHPQLHIPFFSYRGVPIGIDVERVVETGITPIMDIGIAGRGGGQIGAGTLRAPIACFQEAAAALTSA